MSGGAVSEDQIARLRLIGSENIGLVTYFQLLGRFGSGGGRSHTPLAPRGGGLAPKLAPQSLVEREIERVAEVEASHSRVCSSIWCGGLDQ
jgi:hypothetical protein